MVFVECVLLLRALLINDNSPTSTSKQSEVLFVVECLFIQTTCYTDCVLEWFSTDQVVLCGEFVCRVLCWL